MKFVISLFIILFSTIFWVPFASADVTGSVCVISADLISVNGIRYDHDCKDGTRVRLHGIDAPELDQKCASDDGAIFKCGLYAASFLLNYVKGKTIVCHGNSQDIDGNWLMRCYVDEENVNAYMVSEGWALSYEVLSKRYQPQEAEAIKQKKGIWVFNFTKPWEWREGKRIPGIGE